jgi:hypothetical protein
MNSASDFYFTDGGNVPVNASCYVERQADKDIYTALKQGQFCYVLNRSQMGKSSLMVRAARQLLEHGASVAVIELTKIGTNLSPEEWYDGLMVSLGSQLNLEDELEDFWDAHQDLEPLCRWMEAVRGVLLAHCQGAVVIFIDEIDVTRSLPFSADKFFAAIRNCYDARIDKPEFERLTFCLIGAGTPADLSATRFNIGIRIELNDFTEKEAAPLAQGLGSDEKQAKALLKRILYWTNGHPYLTQKLCKAVAEDQSADCPAGVDRICETLFLSPRSRENDHNLQFVRDRILRAEKDAAGLLNLYRQVWERKKIRDDDTQPLIGVLRLSGLVRSLENHLQVRNQIYFKAFDKDWIDAHMPDPTLHKDGYRKLASKYDDRGNETEWAYFDSEDKPAIHKDGYHRVTAKYDDRGKLTELAYFDAAGNPALHKDGYHRVTAKYDDRGKLTEFAYFDTEGNPAQDKDGYHKTTVKLDERGNIIEVVLFDTLGGKSVIKQDDQGNIIETITFDKFDNQIEKMYFDETGKKVLSEASFDSEGKPILGEAVYHSFTVKPDDRGNIIEAALFDIDGRKSLIIKFDEQENIIEKARFETDGGKFVTKCDERGNIIETIKFDINGGKSSITKYDGRGNIIEAVFFKTGGKSVAKCDERENIIETITFDKFGNQTEKKHFDETGKKVSFEGAFFDTEGKPILNEHGYHRFTGKYDDRGNIIEAVLFDTKGGKSLIKKDGRGNIIEKARFESDGGKSVTKCDDRGNKIETIKFDKFGNQIEKKHFDETGKKLSSEAAFFDNEGKPIIDERGYHRFILKYDERENIIEALLFDIEDKPTLYKDGFHKIASKYDDRGNRTEQAYFDTDGKPTLHKNGYHRYTAKYDDRGNQTEWAFFDTEGKPTLHKDGFHRYTSKYDDRGNEIERAFFDLNGQPLKTEIVVKEVQPDGQAEKLGIKSGDIFTHYDGKPLRYSFQFDTAHDAQPPDGSPKELKVLRDGQELIFMISPGKIGAVLGNRVKGAAVSP